MPETVKIEAMTLTRLAQLYEVSLPTIKKWIHKKLPNFGYIDNCRVLPPIQVKEIFEALGEP